VVLVRPRLRLADPIESRLATVSTKIEDLVDASIPSDAPSDTHSPRSLGSASRLGLIPDRRQRLLASFLMLTRL
jgi:hypothetical protein